MPCDLNQFKLILARVQHKKQPQLCTRLFSRLRLQRRGCFSSSTSRKTTTLLPTTTYYGEDKRSKKGDRRLRGGGGGAGATLSGEARRFNQQCYVGVGSEWRGAAVQLTSARLHSGGGGGVALSGGAALSWEAGCSTSTNIAASA